MSAAVDAQTDDLLAATRMERMLIGSCLIDRDAIAGLADWLKPGAFTDTTCRSAYTALLACWQDRVPPDLATIQHGYRANGVAYLDIPFADLSGMVIECPFASHAPHYAQQVAEAAKRRAIAQLGSRMVQGAYAGSFDPAAAYEAAMAEIETLTPDEEQAIGLRSYADLVPEWRDRSIGRWSGERPERIYPLGFRQLDHALRGGLRPGELCILGGRPGSGKTALGLQMVHNIARASKQAEHCLIFSNEMSWESLLTRAVSEVSGVNGQLLTTGQMPEPVRRKFFDDLLYMEKLPVAIDDTGGITTKQMIQRIQRYQRRHNVGPILFDYVELAGDREGDGELERVTEIVRQLKTVARAIDVPVIALSQLSRAIDSRGDKRPGLSDLRYSGEAQADQVMMLYRPEYYDPADRPGECDLLLRKHRNGEVGEYTIRFFKELTAFTDMEETR